MLRLVLLRHGESIWNRENRFAGWTDIDLSEKGVREAAKAGILLRENGFTFDVAYTSVLKRAIRTLWIVLDKMDLMWIPVFRSWRLNERHYGALQGLDKAETALKYGEETVHQWRRSYDVLPPTLEKQDKRSCGHDPRYAGLHENEKPATESLQDTANRFLPYWHEVIAPALHQGKRPILSAHGNSIRALVMYLDNISVQDIVNLNIPTGVPLVYELDDNLQPLGHHYLGNQKAIEQTAEAVSPQADEAVCKIKKPGKTGYPYAF